MNQVKKIFGRDSKSKVNEEHTVQKEESKQEEVQVSNEGLDASKEAVERIAALGHDEDAEFDKARAATREAEQAAKIASANAEKAIRLLSHAEIAAKHLEEAKVQYERTIEQLEDLKIVDEEAKAKRAELQGHKNRLDEKAASFEKLRGEARDINKLLEEKSKGVDAQNKKLGGLREDAEQTHEKVQSLKNLLKKTEADKAKHDQHHTQHEKATVTLGGNLKGLETEWKDACAHADELEKQARAARQAANDKKKLVDEAVVKLDKEKKLLKEDEAVDKDLKEDLTKSGKDLEAAEAEAARVITVKNEAQELLNKLSKELDELTKKGDGKVEAAKKEREAYQEQKDIFAAAQQEARNAVAAQKEAQKTKVNLEKDEARYAKELKQTTHKFSESSEESKRALKAAEEADLDKKRLWEDAKSHGSVASQHAHEKIQTVAGELEPKYKEIDAKKKEFAAEEGSVTKEASERKVVKEGVTEKRTDAEESEKKVGSVEKGSSAKKAEEK